MNTKSFFPEPARQGGRYGRNQNMNAWHEKFLPALRDIGLGGIGVDGARTNEDKPLSDADAWSKQKLEEFGGLTKIILPDTGFQDIILGKTEPFYVNTHYVGYFTKSLQVIAQRQLPHINGRKDHTDWAEETQASDKEIINKLKQFAYDYNLHYWILTGTNKSIFGSYAHIPARYYRVLTRNRRGDRIGVSTEYFKTGIGPRPIALESSLVNIKQKVKLHYQSQYENQ